MAPDSSISRTAWVLALTAIAHVALTAWVRRDARARDVDPSPWDALTLVTGIVGALAYRRCR